MKWRKINEGQEIKSRKTSESANQGLTKTTFRASDPKRLSPWICIWIYTSPNLDWMHYSHKV